MKKKRLKVIASFLVAASIIAANFAMGFAEEENEDPFANYVPPTAEEQIAELIAAGATQEQIETAQKKLSDDRFDEFIVIDKARRVYWNDLPRRYYCVRQSQSASCVPACGQGVLDYINGSGQPITEQYLINNIDGWVNGYGTPVSNLRPWLNNYQSVNTYVFRDRYTAKDTMAGHLNAAIVGYQVPAVVGLDPSVSGWYYDTESSGHAIVIYGVQNDLFRFKVADPYSGQNDAVPTYYTVNVDVLHDAMSTPNTGGYLY